MKRLAVILILLFLLQAILWIQFNGYDPDERYTNTMIFPDCVNSSVCCPVTTSGVSLLDKSLLVQLGESTAFRCIENASSPSGASSLREPAGSPLPQRKGSLFLFFYFFQHIGNTDHPVDFFGPLFF